jgi:hypothetical protein
VDQPYALLAGFDPAVTEVPFTLGRPRFRSQAVRPAPCGQHAGRALIGLAAAGYRPFPLSFGSKCGEPLQSRRAPQRPSCERVGPRSSQSPHGDRRVTSATFSRGLVSLCSSPRRLAPRICSRSQCLPWDRPGVPACKFVQCGIVWNRWRSPPSGIIAEAARLARVLGDGAHRRRSGAPR